MSPRVETANMMLDWTVWPLATYTGKFENHQRYIGVTLVSRCDRATLRVVGAPEGCRFAAAGPNNVRQGYT